MSPISLTGKMADTSKDGLLLGGRICHITATLQFTRRSKELPACIRNIVLIFGNSSSACAKEYLIAPTY